MRARSLVVEVFGDDLRSLLARLRRAGRPSGRREGREGAVGEISSEVDGDVVQQAETSDLIGSADLVGHARILVGAS